MVEEPNAMTPSGKPDTICEETTRSDAPHRKFFMPKVDTNGCGRCRRVSSKPLIRPINVPATIATTISTNELVIPPLTSIPQIQAQNVAFAPTDRSIPAVIKHSSIPVDSSAVNVVCFKTDIKLLYVKNLSLTTVRTTHKIISAASVPRNELPLDFFLVLVI